MGRQVGGEVQKQHNQKQYNQQQHNQLWCLAGEQEVFSRAA
jgi:hypothetical protein